MSSVSSAINSLSAVSIEDYCRYTKQTLPESKYLRLAKYAGFFWGLVTLALSFLAGNIAPTIIEAINKIGSIFYGPILACFLLAFWAKKVQAKHINRALIIGVLSNILLSIFATHLFWFWWNVSGLLITCISALLFSSLDNRATSTKLDANCSESLPRFYIFVMVIWFAVILFVLALIDQFSR